MRALSGALPAQPASRRCDTLYAQRVRPFWAKAQACASEANYSGQTALHLASREGHRDIVQLQLARGVSTIDVRNYEGRTPSHEALAGGHHDLAQLLSQHGG